MNRWLARVVAVGGVVALSLAFAGASNPTYPVATPTVTMPLYGAGLAPQQPPAPSGASVEERLARLEQKIDRVLKIIEDAAADEKANGAPAPPRSNRETLIGGATKCAACHHADVADAKGGGFKLFTAAGAFAPLSARQKQQVSKRLVTNDASFLMPPPASGVKLTDDERAALVAEFDFSK